MRRTRDAVGLLVIAATAIGVLGGPPSTAQAHTVTFKSIVVIDGHYQTTGGPLTGAVYSFDTCKCRGARLVTVWKRNPGAMDAPLGTAKTNRAGRWRLDVTAPAGIYYATVKKKAILRKGGHRHVCSSDRSSNFSVP